MTHKFDHEVLMVFANLSAFGISDVTEIECVFTCLIH